MEHEFIVEKWSGGYTFTAVRRSRISVRFLKFLRTFRWILLAYVMLAYVDRLYVSTVLVWLIVILVEKISVNYVIAERLIMLRGYGLQIESITMTGNETKQLVSIADIDHLMINEGIVMNEVIFYLVITLKKSDKVLVPFGSVIPKLKWLQVVYRTYNEFFEAAKTPVLSN